MTRSWLVLLHLPRDVYAGTALTIQLHCISIQQFLEQLKGTSVHFDFSKLKHTLNCLALFMVLSTILL